MWWMAAAAAAPYVMAAFQKKPKAPGAPAPVQLTNRDGYINQMLDTAYNPSSDTYRMASEQTADQVNRLLGKQGLGGSSVGAQLQQGTQANLAQKWLENASQRQNAALNTAVGYDKAQAGVAQENNNAAYNYAQQAYKDKMQRNANQIQGISGMINAGVGAYNQQQTMDRYDQMIAAGQTQPMATYGTPVLEYSSTGPAQDISMPGNQQYLSPGGY